MLPAQIHHLLSQFTGKAKPADGARIEFSGAAHEASLIEMRPYIQKRDHGRRIWQSSPQVRRPAP